MAATRKANNNYCDTDITKREIIDAFLLNSDDYRLHKNICDERGAELVVSRLEICVNTADKKEILKSISRLRSDFQKKYIKYGGGHHKSFYLNNSDWLNSFFRLPMKFLLASATAKSLENASASTSRKQKQFNDLSESSKRRKIALSSRQNNGKDAKEILLIASKSVKQLKDNELSKLLKSVASPEKAAQVFAKLKQPDVNKYTFEEALNFFYEKRLTWNTYIGLRQESKSRGADLYPSYQELYKVRKAIRPDSEFISVTEFTAVVKTQALVHNTAERIIKLQNEVLQTLMDSKKLNELKLCLLSSWGCDGSSAQSVYNQQSTGDDREKFDESHLFATTMTPLRLIAVGRESKNDVIVWNNNLPQSYRSCRPLQLMYRKESSQLTVAEIARVRNDIDLLSPLETFTSDGRKLIVTFSMYLSVIDGKVLGAIQDTPCQNCPLCKSKPNDFNVLGNVGTEKFKADLSSLGHGASVLHARIRFMEALYNVGIRMDVKKWRVTDSEDKEKVLKRKREIQADFQKVLNLRLDYPNPGGSGNSNNGNTARRFFENYQQSAQILKIDEELIFRFRNILIAINCQLPLKSSEFGSYCTSTNKLFVELYGWYKMPQTVHKILIHSEEIILFSPLPLGMLGEEGAESRNKFYRNDRINHARKNNRVNTFRDVLHRALETSDPLLASFSMLSKMNIRKSKPLPAEVIQFLEEPNIAPYSPPSSQDSVSSNLSDLLENSPIDEAENCSLEVWMSEQEDCLVLQAAEAVDE